MDQDRKDLPSRDPGAGSSPEQQVQSLLARWQEEDDREALDTLLRMEIATLSRRIRGRAAQALRPSASASDLAQEAALRWLKVPQPPQFDTPGQLRAYLWKTAWRLLLDRLDRPSHRVRRISDVETTQLGPSLQAASGLGEVEDKERNLGLQIALNLLKEEDRQVLDLVYFQQLSTRDAAERLGVQLAALEMRLTRARRRLADKLVKWDEVITEV